MGDKRGAGYPVFIGSGLLGLLMIADGVAGGSAWSIALGSLLVVVNAWVFFNVWRSNKTT